MGVVSIRVDHSQAAGDGVEAAIQDFQVTKGDVVGVTADGHSVQYDIRVRDGQEEPFKAAALTPVIS